MKRRITIVTAIYGRHDLCEITLYYYRKLQQNSKHDITLLAVGSEGDKSAELCHCYGWHYTEYDNNPLSQKFNHLFKEAEKTDPELVILVGSDDLVSEGIINWYADNIPASYPDLVGLKDLYFYEIQNDITYYFSGYPPPSPRTIGAGRCFSRHILDKMNFRLWADEKVNRGLDSCSTRQMARKGIGEKAYTMEQLGGVAVDIKHPWVTLTKSDQIRKHSEILGSEILDKVFKSEMKSARNLKKIITFDERKMYEVEVIKPTSAKYGQKTMVNGKLAIEWVIKGIIKEPS